MIIIKSYYIKVITFSGRLDLHSIAIPLDTFPLMDEIWVDQAHFESIITPRNLIFFIFFKIMLFIVTDLCMFIRCCIYC